MADEVTKAKERRWLRQLAEAIAEVIRAEVPENERVDAMWDFFDAIIAIVVSGPCPECHGVAAHRMDCSRLERR